MEYLRICRAIQVRSDLLFELHAALHLLRVLAATNKGQFCCFGAQSIECFFSTDVTPQPSLLPSICKECNRVESSQMDLISHPTDVGQVQDLSRNISGKYQQVHVTD